MPSKTIDWNGSEQTEVVELLMGAGKMVVSPTKVGYVVMTSDVGGLRRKFSAKQRAPNKPGVVLCGSMEQLRELAVLNGEIDAFYQRAWDDDILLGCILPWKESARALVPADGSDKLMMDGRGTSCFVIKFGLPSELIARRLWSDARRMVFASSANPSGQGNSGRVEKIGDRIEDEADLIIAANDYVRSMQPDSAGRARFEQGVMVSMVDKSGSLIEEQKGRRSVQPAPVLIRKGLDFDKIMVLMTEYFPSWDYRHGEYY